MFSLHAQHRNERPEVESGLKQDLSVYGLHVHFNFQVGGQAKGGRTEGWTKPLSDASLWGHSKISYGKKLTYQFSSLYYDVIH